MQYFAFIAMGGGGGGRRREKFPPPRTRLCNEQEQYNQILNLVEIHLIHSLDIVDDAIAFAKA